MENLASIAQLLRARISSIHGVASLVLTVRLKLLESIFQRYFDRLQRERRSADFYSLSELNPTNKLNQSVLSVSELELFVIVSNETLRQKTRFYSPWKGTYKDVPLNKVLEIFNWMIPMFKAQGTRASLKFNFDHVQP